MRNAGFVAVIGVTAACAATSAPPTVTSLPPTAPRSPDSALTARLEAVMNGIDGFSGSVLVARGEELLLSKGYGLADAARGTANDPQTRYRIGSLTKQFTGTAVLLLQQRGLLRVDDPVCRYLDRCPAAWKAITIHHVLTHTAGLPNVTELPQFEKARGLPTTASRQLDWVRPLPLEFTPGSTFAYSNTGYLAAGLVIEKVSGVSYEEFVQSAILRPLGLADSGYDTGDDGLAMGYSSGTTLAFPINMVVPHAAGALYSTAPDLLRWERALVSGTVLDASGTKAMTTSAVDTTERAGFGYSYGLFVSLDPRKPVVAHDGGIDGFLSHLSHNSATGLTVVVLTNHEDAPNLDFVVDSLTQAASA